MKSRLEHVSGDFSYLCKHYFFKKANLLYKPTSIYDSDLR